MTYIKRGFFFEFILNVELSTVKYLPVAISFIQYQHIQFFPCGMFQHIILICHQVMYSFQRSPVFSLIKNLVQSVVVYSSLLCVLCWVCLFVCFILFFLQCVFVLLFISSTLSIEWCWFQQKTSIKACPIFDSHSCIQLQAGWFFSVC